jgi:hypothetical protein
MAARLDFVGQRRWIDQKIKPKIRKRDLSAPEMVEGLWAVGARGRGSQSVRQDKAPTLLLDRDLRRRPRAFLAQFR